MIFSLVMLIVVFNISMVYSGWLLVMMWCYFILSCCVLFGLLLWCFVMLFEFGRWHVFCFRYVLFDCLILNSVASL